VVLLVIMILYHISLNNAINPLLYYLPRSLEAEETALLADHEALQAHDGAYGKNHIAKNVAEETKQVSEKSDGGKPKVNFFKKWLRPDIYCSYSEMRKLVPHDFAEILYSPETERDAYQHPAATNVTPLLWVPRDEMGVSRQECAHTNKVTPMTDEGAHFNDKGKVVWDQEALDGRAPIYEEKIYY
jgi:calcium permeable stress-gated cation channel